jgi:hypothetical protein
MSVTARRIEDELNASSPMRNHVNTGIIVRTSPNAIGQEMF